MAEAEGIVAGFIHIEKYDTLYFETMANILGLAVIAENVERKMDDGDSASDKKGVK